MRILIATLSAWLVIGMAFAQTDSVYYDQDLLDRSSGNTESEPENEKPKKFDVDLSVGTSFSYSPNTYYAPAYYVAPSFRYLINRKFSLSAGIAVQQAQLNAFSSNQSFQLTSSFVYARADYLLSPKIKIGGMVYKSIYSMPNYDPTAPRYNYHGLSLDIQYKVSDSFSFGFQMNQGSNPYRTGGGGLMPPLGYPPYGGF